MLGPKGTAYLIVSTSVKFKLCACLYYFTLQVFEPCKTRTPEYFVITVTNSGGRINATTAEYDHQPRLHSTIDLPQNVDMCSLCVNISAGNSAGMSPPTKIEVGKSW